MSPPKGKIIILEDDPVVGGIYRSKFEKSGFEVEVAPDGQSGFYRILEERPCAILLDLLLPGIDGVEVLRKVRAQKRFQRTPIFAFTNAFLSDAAYLAGESGADRVFNKATTNPGEILAAIEKALFGTATAATAPQPAPQAATTPSRSSETHPTDPPPPAAGLAENPISNPEVLWKSAEEVLPLLRGGLRELTRSPDAETRRAALARLRVGVHRIASTAGALEMETLAHFCSAVEVLAIELHDKPRTITPSTIRTLARAIDFLGRTLEERNRFETVTPSQFNILVVDDEMLSRRAVTEALQRARLKSVALGNPKTALNVLQDNPFDLIVLDADMPGLNGFDLCAALREIPCHATTPVIFVTGLNSLASRARSTLSGANEFIAKPFLFVELSVKALLLVLEATQTASGIPATRP